MSSTPKQSVMKTSSQEEMSSTETLEQIRIKSMKDVWEVLFLKIWRNSEKLVPMCLTPSHRCIPNTIQLRALQTRTLKMENFENCWVHHCILQNREWLCNPLECQAQRGNLLHCHKREEQVQSVLKLIQGKAWRLVRFRNRVHWRNLLHCFDLEMKEPGNQFKSSVVRTADPSNVGRSLVEGK